MDVIKETKSNFVIGCDEAGRGPLAGPVVGAAVCFPRGYRNADIDDSKKLSYEKRDHLFDVIMRDAIAFSIIAVGPRRIEQINILQASLFAMRIATEKILARVSQESNRRQGALTVYEVLVDGNKTFACQHPVRAIIGGDGKEISIGAASILAKVYRDRLMDKLHERFPHYGFAKHSGYPTAQHRTTIQRIGICREHRRTFAGVKEFTSFGPSQSLSQ